MNKNEAISILYQIAEEIRDDLNRNRSVYTGQRRLEALNIAIGAICKEQERMMLNEGGQNNAISTEDCHR